MNTKILGILAMVIVALAGTGVAFGHWVSAVQINGVITSGSFNIETSIMTGNDTGSSCPSVCVTSLVTTCPHTNTNTITTTIKNAYPTTYAWGAVSFSNTGTVPGVLTDIQMTVQNVEPSGQLSPSDEVITLTAGNITAGSFVFADTHFGPQWVQAWYFTDMYNDLVNFNGTIAPHTTVVLHWQMGFQQGLEQAETWQLNTTYTFTAACSGTTAVQIDG